MAGGWRTTPSATQGIDQGTGTLSRGLQLQGNVTTFTKGAWVQVSASLTADIATITAMANCVNNSGKQYGVDIGIGSAGLEQTVISNLCFSNPNMLHGVYHFPLSIPAGTRLVARSSSNVSNDSIFVQILTTCDSYMSAGQGTGIDTYGFNTATNLGTAIDPGGVANTKGAYVQLTASTIADLAGLMFCTDCQANTTGTSVVVNWLIDVAVGAAGSEVVVIPNFYAVGFYSTSSGVGCWTSHFVPVQIPAGSRIAVRAQCNQIGATNRIFGITVYGARL